jgi:hypothetical protein
MFSYPFDNTSIILRLDSDLAMIVIPAMPLYTIVEFFEKVFTLFRFHIYILLGTRFQLIFSET